MMLYLLILTFWLNTEYKAIAYELTAMSVLETGWYKSQEHIERHNLYSMKDFSQKQQRPIDYLKKYNSYKDSLQDMLLYLRRNNYPTARQKFFKHLKLKHFAEDRLYINKIKIITRMLKRRISDEQE